MAPRMEVEAIVSVGAVGALVVDRGAALLEGEEEEEAVLERLSR